MNKKQLYESIMKNVAKQVKKALNESISDFGVLKIFERNDRELLMKAFNDENAIAQSFIINEDDLTNFIDDLYDYRANKSLLFDIDMSDYYFDKLLDEKPNYEFETFGLSYGNGLNTLLIICYDIENDTAKLSFYGDANEINRFIEDLLINFDYKEASTDVYSDLGI